MKKKILPIQVASGTFTGEDGREITFTKVKSLTSSYSGQGNYKGFQVVSYKLSMPDGSPNTLLAKLIDDHLQSAGCKELEVTTESVIRNEQETTVITGLV